MWPAPLARLVQTYGPDAVWLKGLRVLGFPPTWATQGSEYVAVMRALEASTDRPTER